MKTSPTKLITTTSYGVSTDINKELTNEPSTEQSTNIQSESITKVETTRSITIKNTEKHESVTGYYDTTTNNFPTDAETTHEESSSIGRQLQSTTVPMTSHSEDKTTVVQHGFSSEISTSPKYDTTFGSDRTINIEFTTGDKTMESGGFTSQPSKISSTPGQLKTTIPSHSTTEVDITTGHELLPDMTSATKQHESSNKTSIISSTDTLPDIITTSLINQQTSTENNFDTTRRYTSSRIKKPTFGPGNSKQSTPTNHIRYISTTHYVKSSSAPKSTTGYKTEKYLKFPITRQYTSKTTRSTSTHHNSVIGEKQSNKSFPLISKFI